VLVNSLAGFGNVPAGASANSAQPIRFRVLPSAPCGASVAFDLIDILATNGGPFPDALALTSATLGEEPLTTLRYDDFTSPAAWSIVNGGTGAGSAASWTTGNPGSRPLALSAPFFIADSDRLGAGLTMDEELIGPMVDCSGFSSVRLQFAHEFHWYSGGSDEQCDVDVRSAATGGAWVNVAKFQDADTSGTVELDISAQAVGQPNVQVRFHYYDAVYEWWWAVDDVYLLGSNGFDCDVFSDVILGPATPQTPGRGIKK